MGREEVIDRIKKTEAEVRGKIEASARKKNEIIENAKRQAKKAEDDTLLRAKKENELAIAEARKMLDRERQALLEKGRAEAKIMREKANVQKTKEFFMSKFEEYVNS